MQMEYSAISIRPFIGAKDFLRSVDFYGELGFTQTVLSTKLSLLSRDQLGFYLQDAFLEEWINNTMVFLEIVQLETFYLQVLSLNLKARYPEVKISSIQHQSWGKEFFLHDPSGILLHFGTFC